MFTACLQGRLICRKLENYWSESMELTLMDVQRALAKLLNHYPEAGHNSSTISKLALDWFDLLKEEGVTQAQFSAGMRYSVKNCRFFPKLADVLGGVRVYREKPIQGQNRPLLEANTASPINFTPEEIERNKERVQIILDVISKKISCEEGVEKSESICHICEFGSSINV